MLEDLRAAVRRPRIRRLLIATAGLALSAAAALPAAASVSPHSINPCDSGAEETCQFPHCARVAAGMPIKTITSKAPFRHWINNRCMGQTRQRAAD